VCYELLTKGAEVTLTNSSNISAYKAAIMNNSMNGKHFLLKPFKSIYTKIVNLIFIKLQLKRLLRII